jgi:hypothetical protein
MRPLPPLNSNLKSKQLQVNDSPDNSQIPVACFFFKTSGLCWKSLGIIVKNESQSPVGSSSKFVYDTLNVNTFAPVNV